MSDEVRETANKPVIRRRNFTAIDPAERLFTCNCGRPECQIVPLRPLRDHMAVLLRAIVSCGMEETLPGYDRGDEAWPGVIYPLQMAASIEDVFADPSYVDDSEGSFWCGTAWDRDEQDRKEASRYVAALTMFNFVWLAYEAAIRETAGSRFKKDKVPVRGRRLLQEETAIADAIPSLPFLFRLSRHFCKDAENLENEIAKIEGSYNLKGAAAAAELGRLFRNHVVHGDDPVPIYSEPDEGPIFRFYAVSKMLLTLIQAMVLISLVDGDKVIPLTQNWDERRERARWFLTHLHMRDELWIGLDPAKVT